MDASRIDSSRPARYVLLHSQYERRTYLFACLADIARRVNSPTTRATHLVPVRRCLITPTRCFLYPSVLETSNSFLREYSGHQYRILRVQFVDEDGGFPVTGEPNVIDDTTDGKDGVFARIRRVLEYGLIVAGLHFVFLAFSESQSR